VNSLVSSSEVLSTLAKLLILSWAAKQIRSDYVINNNNNVVSVSCISIVCQQPAVAHSLSQPSFSGTLPDDVQSAPSVSSFRRQLKTFLFRQSFPDIIVYIYCAIVDFATVWVVLATLKIPDWHWHRHWHCSEWVPEFTTAVISWTLNSSIFRLLKQYAVKTEPHYRYVDRLFCWGLIQYLTNFHPKLLTSKVNQRQW